MGMSMVPLTCKMTSEMTKDGMICKMMPTDMSQMDMMKDRMNMMMSMMQSGMPCMLACGGMPMMVCSAA
ncbi:MAG: hypothetical protein ACTHU0_06565 [Kofleriaceae bacterium]